LKHPGQRHEDHRDQRGLERGVAEDRPRVGVLAAGEVGDGERLPDSGHRDRDGAEGQHQREQPAIGRTEQTRERHGADEPQHQAGPAAEDVEGQ
jgi:hypothetical protein